MSTWLQDTYAKLDAADLFYGHGTDNAWDEAVQMVLFSAGLPADSGDAVLTVCLTDAQQATLKKLLDARINQRIPLPYLTREAWFMHLPFYVDERVLIPRSPFAEWIDRQFVPWVKPDAVYRILEIGTGSGCIAIAVALRFPHATVDAVDIDPNALAVAAQNVQAHGVADRVNLIQSDVYDALGPQRYDIILSNPPYVPHDEMLTLPPEYAHEPISALEADKDGLAIVDRILGEAANHLNSNGILMIEVGNTAQALEDQYPDKPFIWLEQTQGGYGICLLTYNYL